MMLTCSLQSGSNGNAIYVEAGEVRLLFDAGISGRQAALRLEAHGRDIRDVDALIISHDHTDHVRCAGIYQRKFGLPIYMTARTRAAVWCDLGALQDVREYRSGDTLEFNGVKVHTVRTPHDAADGVCFVVEADNRRLGILTDLGHPFAALAGVLSSVDAAYLESNYEPRMLARSSYPPQLKRRIRGEGGHLSNHEAADLVRGCGRQRPRWIAVAHLSEENNTPETAVAVHRRAIGARYPIRVASRYQPSELMKV